MATSNSLTPKMDGVEYVAVKLVADATDKAINSIPPLAKSVEVTGVVTAVTDYIVLPPLNSCPNGHEITILCNAGGAFEMRTPAASGEKINTVDSDGTQEYLMTDTQTVKVVKVSDTDGWMAHGYTALGAVATAVVPD